MFKLNFDTKAFNKKIKLAQSEINKYKEYNDREIRIGVPDNALHITENNIIKISEYARYNEFGTFKGNIPERPFMRNSLMPHYRTKLIDVFKQKGHIYSSKSVLNALESVARQGVDNVLDSITYGSYEPLKPATIRRKGHSKPLIDSGDLYYAITYNILNRSEK